MPHDKARKSILRTKTQIGVIFWLRQRIWCFGWRIILIEMAYLVFWLAVSFDWDGVLSVLVGVLFGLRWRTWCFGWHILLVDMAYLVFWLAHLLRWHICCCHWCTCCFCLAYFWGGMAWHGMFRVLPFAFSVEKSTPAGKKYTSGAGGAGDKLQLWQFLQYNNLDK